MADPSKTERATDRRRDELRRKGQVAKSQEFNAAILFVLAIVFLRYYLPFMGLFVRNKTISLWQNLPHEMYLQDFMDVMTDLVYGLFLVMAPFFILLVVTALLVNLSQVGLMISWIPLKPDLSKVNPISGFKRLFSLQPMVQLGQNLIKISIFIWISWSILSRYYDALLMTVHMNLDDTGHLLGAVVWEIVWKIALAMFLMAIADLAWQRWYYERNIRMSKQEIKDEHKNVEGDPQIKARIRQMQRKAAMNRMMDAIPRADVILTNPIHLAVVLAYHKDEMNAPTVVAKGAAEIAERIKEQGREYQVPIMENKELARALFRTTEVGEEIPGDLYTAVSEILIYVYQISGKLDDYMD